MENNKEKTMTLKVKVWRQPSPAAQGRFAEYTVTDVSSDMSFLEMMDMLNQQLITKGEEPVAFDHDCREGICGSCSMMINGNPHGPDRGTATCQLHMRRFSDGDSIVVEPWRAKAFPVVKDLCVDRSSLDRIIAAGGFISVNTGSAQDANNLPVKKADSDLAFDFATCIGCGACVATCKNASATLFVAAKVAQLALLPQGQPEREKRVVEMVAQMQKEGFGSCSNTGACTAACPKEIRQESISTLNREYLRGIVKLRKDVKADV
jgi:succinate dehydrogenase / fumarate reductase, iron-sulfur subunit